MGLLLIGLENGFLRAREYRITYRMDREIETLRKRLEFLEEQKREEEDKEKQKRQSIEYNLKIIEEAATNMKERGKEERIMKYHRDYSMMCNNYASAFESIHNALRLMNEQLNPTKPVSTDSVIKL